MSIEPPGRSGGLMCTVAATNVNVSQIFPVQLVKLEPQVIIVTVGGRVPHKLREMLLVQKFESRMGESIEEARNLLNGAPALILVYFGKEKKAGAKAVKELVEDKTFHSNPLLLVGAEAPVVRTDLEKIFGIIGALDMPAPVERMVSETKKLWGRFQEQTRQEQEARSAELDKAAAGGGAQLFQGFKSIPTEYFTYLESLGLLKMAIGGSLYATTVKAAPFIDYLDLTQRDLVGSCQRVLKGADQWVHGHSVRVGYATNRVLTAIGLPQEQVILGSRAALLHVWGFKNKRRIGRSDYLNTSDKEMRAKLGALVRESATKVSFELGMPQESIILAFFARLLLKEDVSREKDHFKIASAIMAADYLDRVSWAQGFFNPQRAYIVLRKFKEGCFIDIEPSICAAIVKLASEGIVSVPVQFALPGKLLHALYAKRKAGELKRDPPQPGEIEVPVEQLSPGMKLSRALCTADGKEVLESDLKLDEDLIWRIWQLAAVRPLEAALIRSREVNPVAENETPVQPQTSDDIPPMS